MTTANCCKYVAAGLQTRPSKESRKLRQPGRAATMDRFTSGPVAQLGARMNGIHEVTGSIPVWSTNFFNRISYLYLYAGSFIVSTISPPVGSSS